ncbi:MAG: hypothetical protein QXX41_05490 [Nitrososphaerota archaeon]
MISDDLLTEFTRKNKGFFDRLLKWNMNSQYVAGKFIGFIPKVTFPLIRYEPYPEITGYGVSLFSKLYKVFKREEYFKRAVLASNAILRMQLPSGAFKSLLKEGSKEAIFDSLMMINGLIDFYEISSEEDVFMRAIIALERMLKIFQSKNILLHLQASEINAPYFHIAKGIIPLIKAYLYLEDKRYFRAAENLADFVVRNFQNQDGGFRLQLNIPSWNRFHYLCYALEGLIALASQNPRLLNNVKKAMVYLINNRKIDGAIYYSFSSNGLPIKNKVDIAATAQSVRIFLLGYSITHEGKFVTAALKALNYLAKRQHKKIGSKLVNGGLPFGYHAIIDCLAACSWATQFATDSILLLLNLDNLAYKEKLIITF